MAVFTISPDEFYAEIPGGTYDVITAQAEGDWINELWLQGDVKVSKLILNEGTRIQVLNLQGYKLSGTSGNDTFDLTGIRYLYSAPHVINLGAGDDTLRAGTRLWVNGGNGNDTLYGGTRGDKLIGGEGDDVIHGGGNIDEVYGGAGADLFVAVQASPKEFDVGEDVTIKDFIPGIDRIDVSGYGISTFSQLQLIMVEPLESTYFSAKLRDTIYSVTLQGVSKEALNAGDFIFYTGGDREITGTEYADRLFASRGGSILNGGNGVNELIGGDGADTFVAAGRDTIIGFVVNVDRVDVRNYGISSFKQLQMILDTDVYGNAYFERRFGDHLYNVTLEDVDADALAAKDFIFYTGTATNIVGTASVDTLFAGARGSTIRGGHGNDTLFGGSGDDILYGGTDWDVMYGGDGNDLLSGDSGSDKAYGGRGDDTYFVSNGSDSTLEEAGEGIDSIISSYTGTTKLFDNVENLILLGASHSKGVGNKLDNMITGNSGDNILKGGDGNDTLNGGSGTDAMHGGEGNDIYVVDEKKDKVIEGLGAGTDLVKASVSYALAANVERLTLTGSGDTNGTGNTLANVITGSSGKNVLKGMAGDDRLVGGLGADDLYGGTGKDTFVFAALKDSKVSTSARDTIFDFSQKAGDRIDLSGIDAKLSTAKNEAFVFVGTKDFSKKAGELRFEKTPNDTYIFGDVDGNGKADFAIHIDAAVTLVKGDFIL